MGLRETLKDRAVFFDTNIFIYLLEGSAVFKRQIHSIQLGIKYAEFAVFASEIVFAEILPVHVKANNRKNIQSAIKFLSGSGAFDLVPVDRDICIRSGFIRGMTGMKIPDALHVATAIHAGCDVFLTNDKRIKTPENIELLALADFEE